MNSPSRSYLLFHALLDKSLTEPTVAFPRDIAEALVETAEAASDPVLGAWTAAGEAATRRLRLALERLEELR